MLTAMLPEARDVLIGNAAAAAAQRAHNRLRLAVIDRDPGFMQVLSNRLDALGWDLRALSSAITIDALVAMRLNALVVDLAVLGPGSWEYLERVCGRLPGLAVIVCTGPSSVAQRVRGLRLGAGYLSILGSLFVKGELGRGAGFCVALIGFGFSMYLTYREVFTLKEICEWCVGSAVLMTILAVLTSVRFLRGEQAIS